MHGFFNQAVGDVLIDAERVEQRHLLEDDAQPRPQRKQLLFFQVGDVGAQHGDAAAVGPQQSQGELEQQGLAGAGDAQQDAGFAAVEGEGDVAQDFVPAQGEPDAVEANHLFGHHQPISSLIQSSVLVMKRLLTRISTDAATTAWVVARPTPRVPPRAFKPK